MLGGANSRSFMKPFKIAPPGRRYVALGLAAATAGGALTRRGGLPGIALAAAGMAFAGACAYFFRDPERPKPMDPNTLYSPGDGRVLTVAREGPGDIVTLRIFLSVFNVHVQRSPCAGTVEWVRHHPGAYRMAMEDEARHNTRTILRLRPPGGREPLLIEQIAGWVARKIDCWVAAGDRLEAGQRYGVIHFGSQVAVHLPASVRCIVKPGQKVTGGITPIGAWTS